MEHERERDISPVVNENENEIMENKNIPQNGLTDTMPELEPLQRSQSHNRRTDFSEEPLDGISEKGDDDSWFMTCARKCRMTPKKAMIYLTVSWIIMTILFVILIIMCSVWPKSEGGEVCTTAECHRVSGVILGRMNRSVEPCEDFWKFSCAGWMDENPIPKSRGDWSNELLEEDRVKHKIRTMINTAELEEETNSVHFKVQRFYESCMAVHYIEVDKDKFLKKIFNELGGWNVLKTFRMNEFDFPRVLRKIHAEYRASPFFKVEVVRDPFAPLKSVIQISPAGLSLPGKSYYKTTGEPGALHMTFKTFAKDVMQQLGATASDASTYANAIYSYEGRIAEAMPDSFNLNFSRPAENYTKIRVDELNQMSNTIFWSDFLKAIFPQGHITEDTEVIATSLEYLKDVSAIISTSDKIILNNYVMWTLTHKYLPYLSKQFVFAHEVFRRGATGAKESTPRWEFCIDETLKVFTPVINAMLALNCERRPEKVDRVTTLFDNIKSSLSARISASARFDEKLRSWALDKLRLMTIHTSTPVDRKFLTDLYYTLGVQHNEFFSNVVQGVQFVLQLQQRELTVPAKQADLKAVFAMTYVPTGNKVHFPEALFQSNALVVAPGQNALLYGTLGVEIAEAVAGAFGPKQGLYLADGRMMTAGDPKYSESVRLIEEKRSCLQSFFTNIHLDDENYIIQTSLDTTVHLAGIEIALAALGEDSSGSSSLPSINYDKSGLFFIAYGQSQCSATTLAFHDMEHSVFSWLTPEYRVRGLLRQLGPFTEAFKCPKTSEMYADFRCGHVL